MCSLLLSSGSPEYLNFFIAIRSWSLVCRNISDGKVHTVCAVKCSAVNKFCRAVWEKIVHV